VGRLYEWVWFSYRVNVWEWECCFSNGSDTMATWLNILLKYVYPPSYLPPPFFSNFLFTNLFSIKFLYFFIISSLFPYFNLFVSIFIQSCVNIKLHVSTLLTELNSWENTARGSVNPEKGPGRGFSGHISLFDDLVIWNKKKYACIGK
jgi:hypothetical protein